MTKRFVIAQIKHETNTFSPIGTPLAAFGHGDGPLHGADAKRALEAGGTDNMNGAAERLQQASHKIAEAMYRGAAGTPSAGASEPPSSAESGKEDEVIDTEYVDTEKT